MAKVPQLALIILPLVAYLLVWPPWLVGLTVLLSAGLGYRLYYRRLVQHTAVAKAAQENVQQRLALSKQLQTCGHHQGLMQLALLAAKFEALLALIEAKLSATELTRQRLEYTAQALHDEILANLQSAVAGEPSAPVKLSYNEVALTELDQISARLARIQQDQASWPLQEAAAELAKTLARLQGKSDARPQ